jgi:hypothetical protein
MDIDGIIRPESWERGLGLMGGLVAAKREEGVMHPATKEGRTLSVMRDEINSFAAKTYAATVRLPDQSILDWWTAFSIMTFDLCKTLLPENIWVTESDAAQHTAANKWAMGTRHIDAFGHDAVIIHADYWLEQIEGTQISSSDFTFGELGVTPSMFEESQKDCIMELGRWTLTGMMIATDLWDLPPAPQEDIDET